MKNTPRFCKYIYCKKPLPEDAHPQKKYCPDTDCYSKQNKLEAKEKCDALRVKKTKKFRICNFDECGKVFEVPTKRPLQAYHSEECRKANYAKGQKERYEERIEKKPKDSGLPEWTQIRGNITNSNTGWAGNINA